MLLNVEIQIRINSKFTPNNFGESDIFKVTLIASGGVSGGFSSWIAGGKFIDGFRQGLITSGLNHAAHAVVEGGPGDPPKKKKITQKNSWDLNGDGKLQKIEGDLWGMKGGGDITVDGNLIDMTGFDESHLIHEGGNLYKYNTTDAFLDFTFETFATYGGGYFKLVDGKYQMQSAAYDFEYRSNNSIENIGRNILNFIGDPDIYMNLIRPGHKNLGISVPVIKVFKPFKVNVIY